MRRVSDDPFFIAGPPWDVFGPMVKIAKGTTMTAQHTPGPWKLRDNISSIGIVGAGNFAVCACRAYEPGIGKTQKARDMRHANARLIAAAPELLEALKEMREVSAACFRAILSADNHEEVANGMKAELERLGIKDGFGVRAQTVIAKAEGGQ